MNIVHVAPPFLALDENLQYGGIERIINMLRYKQQQLDIPTFVLAPSDSTVAGLIPTVPSIGIDEIYAPLTGQDKVRQSKWAILNHVVKVIEYARSSNEEKKLFHVHDDYLLPFLPQILGKPYLFSAYNHYPDFWQTEEHPDVAKDVRNIVAVSEAHKRNLESHGFSIHAVVYNGIEPKDFPFSDQKDNFLLSLGVIAPHKGQKLAVEIAQESAQNLIIAGNIGDNAYFDKFIKPYVTFDLSTESDKLAAYNSLTQKQGIIYVGSVNDTQKKPLFKKAKAFLMPTLCEDPCPAVPIESLVCGTPVIALANGSLPEMIVDGKTGFLCQDITQMVQSLSFLPHLNPSDCRADVEKRFSLDKMARDYLKLYQELITSP